MTAIASRLVERTTSVTPDRLLHVDALRGFALFGILAVNVWAFADPYYGTGASSGSYSSAMDNLIRVLTSLFFETKFYLLFSFLFGYSFTLQMASAERACAGFVPRMLRRQSGLLLIGVLHGALLFHGEILSIYAVLGLVLLAARKLTPRWAITLAGLLIVSVCGLFITFGVVGVISGDIFETTLVVSLPIRSAYLGGPLTTLLFHVEQLLQTQVFLWIIQGPSALAMFLLGFAAGRQQLLVEPYRFVPYERLFLRIALPVGLIGALFYALIAVFLPGNDLELLAFGIGELTAPLLAAAYVVLMLRRFRTTRGQRLAMWLAPLGKISLSNYVLQSVVLGIVFSGYGFGLISELPSPLVILLVCATFYAQLWLSKRWLCDHPYGPLEWLLRALTILSWPNWRRTSA